MVKIGLFFVALAAVPAEAWKWKWPFFEKRVMGEDYPEVFEKPPINETLMKPPGMEHMTKEEIREVYNRMLADRER